jgi:hypothetical protein
LRNSLLLDKSAALSVIKALAPTTFDAKLVLWEVTFLFNSRAKAASRADWSFIL